jgi:peroxiredoxin
VSGRTGAAAARLWRAALALRWRRWALEALVVLALFLGIRAWQQQGVADGPAPPLAGVLLDGRSFDLLAAAKERPVLVYFWASWCSVCRLQQGTIDNVARDHDVVTIAMRSGDTAAVQRHLAEHALTFPVLNDPQGTHAAQWGARAVPASFVVDGEGRIRFVEVGYTSGWGLRSRLWWAGWRAGG